MKLYDSITELKNTLDNKFFYAKGFKASAKNMLDRIDNNPKIKDKNTAIRFTFWQAIDKATRDHIISKSNVACIGGVYDVNDSHIETLLKKALPIVKIAKMRAYVNQ